MWSNVEQCVLKIHSSAAAPQVPPEFHMVVSSVRLTIIIHRHSNVQRYQSVHQSKAHCLRFLSSAHLVPKTIWLWSNSTAKQRWRHFGQNNNNIGPNPITSSLRTFWPWNFDSNAYAIVAYTPQNFKRKLPLVVAFWIFQEFLPFLVFFGPVEEKFFLHHTTKLCPSKTWGVVRLYYQCAYKISAKSKQYSSRKRNKTVPQPQRRQISFVIFGVLGHETIFCELHIRLVCDDRHWIAGVIAVILVYHTCPLHIWFVISAMAN